MFRGGIKMCDNLTDILKNNGVNQSEAMSNYRNNYVWKTVEELESITEFPDPFIMHDGNRVISIDDWDKQRLYLKEMLAHYMYGHMPQVPDNISGEVISQTLIYDDKAIVKSISIKCGPMEQVKFNMRLVYPNKEGFFPIIIKNDWDEKALCPIEEKIVVDRGYAIAVFNRGCLAPDALDYTKGVYPVYPNYDWRTLAVWAWGYSLVIDYLSNEKYIDLSKICATGHSRGGKAALCAGIFDERIKVVVPNGSGCGGVGSLRFIGGHNGFSQNPNECETVGRITSAFPYWFISEFRDFGGATKPHDIKNESKFPFDAHFLRALIAPRACLSTDGFHDDWANPYGTQLSWQGAQPVYDLLGVSENNAIFVRDGLHDQNAEDWKALVDYCDKVLNGKSVETVFNNARFDNVKMS